MTRNENQIEILDSRRLPVRIGLLVVVLLALLFGWFAARWQLGDMLAELTGANDPNAQEIAALAVRFAPADPTANWLLATAKKEDFTPETISEAATNFEKVARLSPNEYRWWIELGRAREQSEEINLAEKAFRRAVELAPNYIYPHWQLGNFYLRQNRSEEAFAELKKAAENNSIYRDQVFSIAWDYYDKDTARLEQIAGDSPSVRAGLAKFYASKERAEDSLRIWNTLSEEDRQANTAIAKVIAQAFYEKRIFRQSLEFIRGLGIEPEARQETVQNGGFERPIGNIKDTYFGWRVAPIEKVEVKLDPTQKHEGSRSLRITFSGYSEPTLYAISQYVTVEPSAKYRLTFWFRTENLKSGGTPALEIYNANDDKGIVKSDSFPTGTSDWQQVKLEFIAPANAEAVGLRTVRAFCGNVCPIFGTLWYDDFKLERLK
ncbi:MAG: carbohydrate binding domain-containing protein [Pyrinomonadaceae bacterium]